VCSKQFGAGAYRSGASQVRGRDVNRRRTGKENKSNEFNTVPASTGDIELLCANIQRTEAARVANVGITRTIHIQVGDTGGRSAPGVSDHSHIISTVVQYLTTPDTIISKL